MDGTAQQCEGSRALQDFSEHAAVQQRRSAEGQKKADKLASTRLECRHLHNLAALAALAWHLHNLAWSGICTILSETTWLTAHANVIVSSNGKKLRGQLDTIQQFAAASGRLSFCLLVSYLAGQPLALLSPCKGRRRQPSSLVHTLPGAHSRAGLQVSRPHSGEKKSRVSQAT